VEKPARWHDRAPEHPRSRPVTLLNSPAYRVLSRAAHLVLSRIELELRNHGGYNSARLAVTFDDFVEYGIHRHGVAPALREVEALGIVLITERGRGGNRPISATTPFLS